ncbi:MAG: YARHG domain-containing protein [Lachnospiraceae bacterium]|nr:YARHG domain-containing protein [Lachnospiraceae bacterium]
MNKKTTVTLALFAMGVVVFIMLALNVYVIVQGRVSLHQTEETAEQNTEDTEQASEGESESLAVPFTDFRVDRSSNVIGDAAEAKSGKKEEDKDEDGEEESEVDKEYLCADAIVRVLNDDDVEELKKGTYDDLPGDRGIIQMVINEIYARNGYQFENPDISAYFSAKDWYKPKEENASDMDAIYKQMSEIDKANIDFLKELK